ncbi:MAG TPA: peptidase C15 [Kamptonema sp.]|nr:peptidase C15 [Kamptonema sp.]
MPHHQSNSSDDLLAKISTIKSLPYSLTFLRQLPVDFQLAPIQAIAKINELQPDLIICCGMAESRQKLTVESTAIVNGEALKTTFPLEDLVADLTMTEISHDAGKFVCEALYYSLLKYIKHRNLSSQCIFIHVPVLTNKNIEAITSDFLSIINFASIARG